MSDHQCTANPAKLDPKSGSGHVEKLGGLDTYISSHSKLAVVLVCHVFVYETPQLRKLAEKVAEAGFYAVVPDFFHGDPYNPANQDLPLPIWIRDHGQVKSFVKIFPRVKHGWTVRYDVNDPSEVEAAEKAHKDMLVCLINHVR